MVWSRCLGCISEIRDSAYVGLVSINHHIMDDPKLHEKFDIERCETMEEVRQHIQVCEGKHTQQAIYSTFHDALTQICYGCKRIRTTLNV